MNVIDNDMRKWPNILGMAACACFMTFWLVKSFHYVPHDYANSYFGAYFFLQGKFTKEIFEPLHFNQLIKGENYHNIFASFNPNPPFAAIFFSPLALLPLQVSKLVFNIGSCLLFIITVYRFFKFYNIPRFYMAVLPVIFFTPLRNQILFGQTYFLLFFLIGEGYLAHQENKKVISALLWSLAALIKIFPAIIVIYVIIKKDWRTLAYFTVISLVILTACIALQGIDVWATYLSAILPKNNMGEINSAFMTNYQSAHMFLKYAFLENSDLNPQPIISNQYLFYLGELIWKSVLLTFCVSALKKGNPLSFGILMLAGLLISPYGSTYSNLLLIFLLLAAFKLPKTTDQIIVLALVCLICNLPLKIFSDLPTALQFPRLFFSVLLLIFLYAKTESGINWKAIPVFILLFSLPLINVQHAKDNSTLLFKNDGRNLIFDYFQTNNHLTYRFWSEQGEQTHETDLAVTNISFDGTTVRNNQVFLGNRQLTNTPDKKLKPAIINNAHIIYLSDKDRGFGFYNLRSMPLK